MYVRNDYDPGSVVHSIICARKGWLSMSINEESDIACILGQLKTHPELGLTNRDAAYRLRRHGFNVLKVEHDMPLYVSIALFIVAALLVIMRLYIYSVLTVSMAVCVALLRYWYKLRRDTRHSRSGRATSGYCGVIREGKLVRLSVNTLVPGDIVRLQCGDMVPADGRLTEAVDLSIDERVFCSSSKTAYKDALIPMSEQHKLELSPNMVYMNTKVVTGRGEFVVTHTGRSTRIAAILLTEATRAE